MRIFFKTGIQFFADGSSPVAVGGEASPEAEENGSADSGENKERAKEPSSDSDSDSEANGSPAECRTEGTRDGDGKEADTENGENTPDDAASDENESTPNGDGGQDEGENGEKELAAVRDSLSEALANAEAEEIIASWKREEESTREIYPAFSMQNELLHEPLFGTLLKSGVGVRQSYECVHLKEIIGSAMRYAVAETGRRAAFSVRSAAERPGENSVLDRAASVARTDVNSLTDRDIMRILSEVSKGAKISFK